MPRRRDPLAEPYEVTEFIKEVGERIRLLRLARSMTQAELAERADISRLTLMGIEAGTLSSRFSDVARLLWVLDDVSLQNAMASAARDELYQEASRANFPRFKRRKKGEE